MHAVQFEIVQLAFNFELANRISFSIVVVVALFTASFLFIIHAIFLAVAWFSYWLCMDCMHGIVCDMQMHWINSNTIDVSFCFFLFVSFRFFFILSSILIFHPAVALVYRMASNQLFKHIIMNVVRMWYDVESPS